MWVCLVEHTVQAAYSVRSSFTKKSYAQNLQSMPMGQNSEDEDDDFLDAGSEVLHRRSGSFLFVAWWNDISSSVCLSMDNNDNVVMVMH